MLDAGRGGLVRSSVPTGRRFHYRAQRTQSKRIWMACEARRQRGATLDDTGAGGAGCRLPEVPSSEEDVGNKPSWKSWKRRSS